MSFINDFKDDDKKGSNELKITTLNNRKLKPRFSVNLSDEDAKRVKDYCESRSISCAAFARMLILNEINK